MAGGPVFPNSAFPATADRSFQGFHTGGTNSRRDFGLQVESSVGADTEWQLRFIMPPTLPTGTGKLRLLALANATSGNAKINPSWASVAPEESPDSVSLNAEGTSTLSWSTGDADQYKELEITLDGDTLTAGEVVVMHLTFETTDWTLAAISTWIPMIVFED